MFGCLRRIGCLFVLCIAAVAAYLTRDRWMPLCRREDSTPRDDHDSRRRPDVGAGERRGARRARAAPIESLGRRSGPVFVNLPPGDVASYFYIALAEQLPPSADSIEATTIGEPDVRPRRDLARRLQGGRRARTAGGHGRAPRATADGRHVRRDPARASRSSSSKTLGSASCPFRAARFRSCCGRSGADAAGRRRRDRSAVRGADLSRRRARSQRQGHPVQDDVK